MRKIYFLLCLCVLGIASQAQQLLYEPFNYPADATLGLWTQSSGVWSGVNSGDSILVASGNLSYTGLPASTGNKVAFDGGGKDYYANFTSQTTGSIYSSFILNVSSLGGLSTAGGYFAGVLQSGSTSAFGGVIWTRASTTAGKYNIGISTRSNSTVSWLAAELDPGTSYFIVSAYDIVTGTANDVARIWLNPSAIGGAEPTADATAVPGTDMTSVARYFLRQDNTTNTPFIEMDEIRVGTAWASVTPSGTISTPTLTAGSLTSFGNTCVNTTAGLNSFTITGSNLTAADVTVGPLAGYSFSTSATGPFTPTLTLTQSGGSYSQTVYVQFAPTAVQSYNGTISVSGGGATATTVTVSGAGVNSTATVTTEAATGISTTTAGLGATITDNGCSAATAYGFEYSTTSGFANGAGTQVPSTNLVAGTFSATLSGLTASTTYYYKAFITNAGGTSYGAEQSFTTSQAPPAGAPLATAATNVTSTGFTANWNAVTGATGYRLDVYTVTPVVPTVIAGWDFLTNTSAADTANKGNGNNIGIQVVKPNGLNTVSHPTGPNGSSGSTPYSISANGWDNGADTKYWQIDVNTTGATNLTLSSMQGSSSTGPSSFKVQYKVGASGTWTDLPGATVTLTTAVGVSPATWGAITDLSLPAAVENQSLVSFRWISTSNTAINGGTVSATGTSRISAIYIKSMPVGGPAKTYVTGYQDLPVGNVTSYTVTGLAPTTTYYYVVRAVNTSGTSPNSNEVSVTTAATPSLTVTTLNAFGNVCINTPSAVNSFTISAANLVSGDLTVGPLTGYSFSTSATGPFTSTLTLSQAGGTYNQTVYVQLTPTSVQAYNGDIPVSGGGLSAAVTVAASGSGVNTSPTVATGAASAVTLNSATVEGTISSNGCSAIAGYGIEYSTTAGFTNGSGTTVPATNLSGTTFTVNLAGLTPSTTYYYKAYATNAGGTTYGTEQSFTTQSLNPALSANTLAAFGDVCLNTPSTAGSFTITGSNLTAADVTVGPLAGYSFATTANGTYTSSLALAQSGSSYSQTVYVKLTPTAVQSYDGNIPVSGGGVSAAINVAASGAGVNTPPVVATGAASSITTTGASLAGTISNNGCTAVSAYGIEYSTTSGFASGTGTKVASTNLGGTSFTSALSGLTASTTYYFKAYATNAGGTTYGTQESFTTLAPPPPAITVSSLASFGSTCVNTPVGPNSFTITGVNLTTANVTVGPVAGYTFATTATGTYTPSLTLTPAAGAINQTVYVKFTPTVAQSYSGNIPVTGGGVTTAVNVAATATGVNTTPAVATGNTTNITTNSAVLAGSITANGCSNVTSYGIEYSGINNFDQGTGTKINATNLAGNNFSVRADNLVQGATYYYRAYAVNNGGIAYGPQQTFTVTAIPNDFVVYPNPVSRGRELRFSTTNLKAGYHGVVLYNSAGTKVFEKGFNVQINFINNQITVPAALTPGVYWVQLINNTSVIGTKTILVF